MLLTLSAVVPVIYRPTRQGTVSPVTRVRLRHCVRGVGGVVVVHRCTVMLMRAIRLPPPHPELAVLVPGFQRGLRVVFDPGTILAAASSMLGVLYVNVYVCLVVSEGEGV